MSLLSDLTNPLFIGLAWLLAFFYDVFDGLIGSNAYAVAIVLLTLTIMVAFTPLTIKGTRSMMQMSTLQPEIKRLQAAHRGDRQKLNEEMMKLYQTHGVSPLGGCLPTLIQIPVFFILYRVINGLTRMTSDGEGFDPDYLDENSQLFRDLVADGEMRSFGMDLARSANDVLVDDFVAALPYLGLVLITFGLSWLQQRQMKARRSGVASPNRQMEVMMKVLPFLLPVFSFIVQAALAVYFVASSLYRIAQQAYIHRTMKAAEAQGPSLLEAEAVTEIDPDKSGDTGELAPPPAAASPKGGGPKAVGPRGGGQPRSKKLTDRLTGGGAGRTAPVPESPEVANERSRKALEAERQRLEDRAARSAARRAAGSAGAASEIGSARVAKPQGSPKGSPQGAKKQGSKKPASPPAAKNKSAASSQSAASPQSPAPAEADSQPQTPQTNGATTAPAKTGLLSRFGRGSKPGADASSAGNGRNGKDGKPVANGKARPARSARPARPSRSARNGKSGSDDSAAKPIQSRRTAGDGRSRSRKRR